VFQHGPLVLAFSFAAVSYSRLLREDYSWPEPLQLLVAFATALLFFLQLRIADEFKDFEEDSRYRPYRAVPRGLVRLRELAWIGAGAACIQFVLAIWLHPPMVFLLLGAWIYLAAMSREFFVREWLVARPITYLWTHMLILPLIDLYATACDWLVAGLARPPAGIYWFLIVSFFNGVLIEIGRKIRSPADEETGVQTYSVLWGTRNAVAAWMSVLALNLLFACLAARQVGFLLPVGIALALLLAGAAVLCATFLRNQAPGQGKRFELFSGIWTIAMYFLLGIVPLVTRLLTKH
jgi:4-hydroxybenzoate polyprenyltransferase